MADRSCICRPIARQRGAKQDSLLIVIMPKVTVIIPTFNRSQFVTKAIESVLRQSYTDYEIIVVDDGSIDNTGAALKSYSSRIRYLYQANAGVSAARNAGIKQARGEWLAFLDSDDEWLEEYLATQMAHTVEFPRAVAHITNAVHVLPDVERTNHFKAPLLRKFRHRSCFQLEKAFSLIVDDRYYWFLQSSILRRDLFLGIRLFDEKLSIAEDLDLIARSALAGPVTFCSKALVEIHRRKESVENQVSQRNRKPEYCYRAYDKVYTSLLKRCDLSVKERLTAARVLCSYRRALGNVALTKGRKSVARRIYRQSLCVYPSVRACIKFLATFLPQRMSLLFVRE